MTILSVGENFMPVETEVNFLPNEARKTITVPLVNDDVQELNKWFQAQLDLPVEQVGVVLLTPVMVNITVLEDDCEFKINDCAIEQVLCIPRSCKCTQLSRGRISTRMSRIPESVALSELHRLRLTCTLLINPSVSNKNRLTDSKCT